MDESIKPIPQNQGDIILWPNNDWCYRFELEVMTHKSDDYRIVPVNTDEWDEISRQD